MKKKTALSIIATLALSGCATFGQLETGLNGLVGKDLQSAVAVFGYPVSEREVAGMRLVDFGRSSSGYLPMPSTSSTNGYVQSGVQAARFSSTTTTIAPMAVDFQCLITLQIDSGNVIRGYQYNGNLGGCEPYILALKKS